MQFFVSVDEIRRLRKPTSRSITSQAASQELLRTISAEQGHLRPLFHDYNGPRHVRKRLLMKARIGTTSRIFLICFQKSPNYIRTVAVRIK